MRSLKIKKLSSIVKTGGLGLFLITGLSGCNSNDDCKNISNLSNSKLEECKKNSSSYYSTTSSANKSDGYFSHTSGSYSS